MTKNKTKKFYHDERDVFLMLPKDLDAIEVGFSQVEKISDQARRQSPGDSLGLEEQEIRG